MTEDLPLDALSVHGLGQAGIKRTNYICNS